MSEPNTADFSALRGALSETKESEISPSVTLDLQVCQTPGPEGRHPAAFLRNPASSADEGRLVEHVGYRPLRTGV